MLTQTSIYGHYETIYDIETNTEKSVKFFTYSDSNHTPEFMSGYTAGFSACSDGGTLNGGDNSDNSKGGGSSNQDQSQSQLYKDGFAVGNQGQWKLYRSYMMGKTTKLTKMMKENVLALTRISAVDCLIVGTRLYLKVQHQTSD